MHNIEIAKLVDWPKKIEITKLHQTYGSPTWIVNEQQLIANVKLFEDFTGHVSQIYYPVKTNPSLTILQILAKLGVGADCASNSEIDLALFAGINIKNISYNTPAQDIDICKSLLLAGAKVVMDDVEAILELQAELKQTKFIGNIFLRINLPEFVSYTHVSENQDLMAHGHKSSKFGIPLEDLEEILKHITLPISGLHVHVGTQMDNIASFEFAVQELNNLADKLNAQGHSILDINIGGGLGIPFSADQNFPSLEFWSKRLSAHKKCKYRYSVEPGHALVGNTVALLTEILTIKSSRGKKWAIVDAGTDQLAKITLLKWPHRILNHLGEELTSGGDAIAGPLCFAGDTLLDNVSLSNLKKGAAILITEVGAYTYSLTNKFNGRLAPNWVLIAANGQIVKTMDKETSYDNSQLLNHEWAMHPQSEAPLELDINEIAKLSSVHLKEVINEDQFNYLKISRIASNAYEFSVLTSSKVSFISMPLAIRIFGDAGIIAILHKNGYTQKEFSLWGRKLSLDSSGLVRSNKPLNFTIGLSEEIISDGSKILTVRFKTSCGKCSGSFVAIY